MSRRLLARQAGTYLLTGGSAALVDIAVFALLLRAGLPVVPAATASFACGTVVNYLLSARFVFAHPWSLRGYARFVAVAGLGLVLNVGLTALLTARTPLPPVAAKIVAIAISFVFNFTLNALVVFRPKRAD